MTVLTTALNLFRRFVNFCSPAPKLPDPDEFDSFTPIELKGTHRGRVFKTDIDTILELMVVRYYPGETVVVLYDINPLAKPRGFWDAVPTSMAAAFRDPGAVLFLVCRGSNDGYTLLGSIPPSLATAHLFIQGCFEDSNQ